MSLDAETSGPRLADLPERDRTSHLRARHVRRALAARSCAEIWGIYQSGRNPAMKHQPARILRRETTVQYKYTQGRTQRNLHLVATYDLLALPYSLAVMYYALLMLLLLLRCFCDAVRGLRLFISTHKYCVDGVI